MIMIFQKEKSPVKKTTVQTNLTDFFRGNINLEGDDSLVENSSQLKEIVKKESLLHEIIGEIGASFGNLPKTAVEFCSSFKTDFSLDLSLVYWAMMRKDEIFDPENQIFKNGLLLDQSQHAGLILSEYGLESLNLSEILNHRSSKLYHHTENELKQIISQSMQDGGVINFDGIGYSAELFGLLIQNLKNAEKPEEEGYYSIAVVLPDEKDDGYWPLLIKNNVTQMLGVLAPR
jgi:hypothetical protein